jgi:hypothetical protein
MVCEKIILKQQQYCLPFISNKNNYPCFAIRSREKKLIWTIVIKFLLPFCSYSTLYGIPERRYVAATVNCNYMKMTEQNHNFTPKRTIFQKTMYTKKNVSARWSPSKGFRSAYSGLNRGWNFFFSKLVITGIKRSVFLRRSQKCKLTLVTKCI